MIDKTIVWLVGLLAKRRRNDTEAWLIWRGKMHPMHSVVANYSRFGNSISADGTYE